MRINKDALKAKANKISKECGLSQTIVYNRFSLMLSYLDFPNQITKAILF